MMRIPSLALEKRFYDQAGIAWTPSIDPLMSPPPPIVDPASQKVSAHGDTEADDLLWNLVQWERTGRQEFLRRAYLWGAWHTKRYEEWQKGQPGAADYDFRLERGYGWDHAFVEGLLRLWKLTDDARYLAVAEFVGDDIYRTWVTTPGFGPGWTMARYGGRGEGRHALAAIALAVGTQKSRWWELVQFFLKNYRAASDWHEPTGYYWPHPLVQDGVFVSSRGHFSRARGYYITSSFSSAILHEAHAQLYTIFGEPWLKERMVGMARCALDFGLDPFTGYTASWYGVDTGQNSSRTRAWTPWHRYTREGWDDSVFDPAYTTSLVNMLVRGYIHTGESAFLQRARQHWMAGNWGIFGLRTHVDGEQRHLHHFADTATDGALFAYNKGELQYVYELFGVDVALLPQAPPPPHSFVIVPPHGVFRSRSGEEASSTVGGGAFPARENDLFTRI